MHVSQRASELRHKSSHPSLPVTFADTSNGESLSLAPAAVLPEQLFNSPRAALLTCGEAALMRAVLDDAISCYEKQFVTRGKQVQRLAREAEAWLFSDDECWPFSFVNICSALGLDPAYVRRELKRRQHLSSARLGKKRRRVLSGVCPSLSLAA